MSYNPFHFLVGYFPLTRVTRWMTCWQPTSRSCCQTGSVSMSQHPLHLPHLRRPRMCATLANRVLAVPVGQAHGSSIFIISAGEESKLVPQVSQPISKELVYLFLPISVYLFLSLSFSSLLSLSLSLFPSSLSRFPSPSLPMLLCLFFIPVFLG